MDLSSILLWLQDHTLAVVALAITIVLVYHYLIERDHGVKLSKKYRNAIYEAQSKIFLATTQHLIDGDKEGAIKEFLNAIDLNRDSIDAYFALGSLFRNNGEIEKAISIHRSLIARENISESTRLQALRELAIDFDKGGFVGKAIETYKDVLKINRDQYEMILALCRIFENIEEWDEAYKYRIMLSKVAHENQAETISHILVEKAKKLFDQGNYSDCWEDLEDAFRFAPSIAAKILKLRLFLVMNQESDARDLFYEILREHPMFTNFLFVVISEYRGQEHEKNNYFTTLKSIEDFFLNLEDTEVNKFPSVVLSKIRLLKSKGENELAYDLLSSWIEKNKAQSEVLKIEYIKLLIDLGKKEESVAQTAELLSNLQHSFTRHYCSQCGFNSDEIFWRCPQCYNWETMQFRWKV